MRQTRGKNEDILTVVTLAHDILSRARDELLRLDKMDDDLFYDIDYILPELLFLNDRIILVGLMSAAVGDVAVPTIEEILDAENKYKLPYDEDGEIDTEDVYNSIDGLVAGIKAGLDE